MRRRDLSPAHAIVELALAEANPGGANLDVGAVPEQRTIAGQRVEPCQAFLVERECLVVLTDPLRERAALGVQARLDDGIVREQLEHAVVGGAGARVRAEVLADVAECLGDVCRLVRGHDAFQCVGRRERALEQFRRDDVREALPGPPAGGDGVAPAAFVVAGLREMQ